MATLWGGWPSGEASSASGRRRGAPKLPSACTAAGYRASGSLAQFPILQQPGYKCARPVPHLPALALGASCLKNAHWTRKGPFGNAAGPNKAPMRALQWPLGAICVMLQASKTQPPSRPWSVLHLHSLALECTVDSINGGSEQPQGR